MLTEIDSRLLEKIADLTGKPVGAFNIRKDSGCEARQSTEHIEIVPQPEGKSGIIIRVKPGTKGEQCHIPVIISKTGLSEMVYNDFYIGEDCDVDIVAGCGIHNSGCDESRHDGVHTFYVGKNSHVHYSEKHYGEGDGNGKNVMNPQTIVYLEEGASIQMDTVQIRGIDSTKRYTKIVCGKDAEGVVTERLLTHGHQEATSDMEIVLDGENSRGRVISRSVAQDESSQLFYPRMVGNAKCFGHVQCDSIIMGSAKIRSIPEIAANSTDAQLIHEAAIGKIAGDQLNEAVVKYMRRKHNVLVGERTAELMKMEIGCVFPKEQETSIEIKGRCLMTGLPKTITVTSTEMLEAFEEPVERILEAVHGVLERTPPELVADISNNGIVMTGGGSLVDGFDRLIEARTGIHTVVAEDAISCVAEGTGKSLDSLNAMTDGTVNLSRRRQMN